MRFILYSTLLFLSLLKANAQQYGRVEYEVRQDSVTENMHISLATLTFCDTTALYSSKVSPNARVVMKVFYPGKQKPVKSFMTSGMSIDIYTGIKTHELVSAIWPFIGSEQVSTVERPLTIKWQMLNEEKLIGEIRCLKATCSFRGRTYTAWYAPSIAVPFGPWKLNGLPGLILEAYDSQRIFQYLFKGFTPLKASECSVVKPKTSIVYGAADYFCIEAEVMERFFREGKKSSPDVVIKFDRSGYAEREF